MLHILRLFCILLIAVTPVHAAKPKDQLVIGITAADRAEIRGEASLLIGDPPIPFVTAPSCSEVAP